MIKLIKQFFRWLFRINTRPTSSVTTNVTGETSSTTTYTTTTTTTTETLADEHMEVLIEKHPRKSTFPKPRWFDCTIVKRNTYTAIVYIPELHTEIKVRYNKLRP